MAKKTELRDAPEGDSQLELFAPAFVDVAFRDQQDLMENPLCTLGKTPRKEPIKYQVGNKFVSVTAPPEIGISTIYDHDILIWAFTQIREAADQGLPTSPRIIFHPYNLLKSIRRETGGREYGLLKEAIRRLNATLVETNIRPDDQPANGRKEKTLRFTLLNSSGEITEDNPQDDRWFIELPSWLYRGVINHRMVLSIDADYFLLTSGLDKWLYRVFRKHAGNQETGWQFTMRQLHAKSGSTQRFSNFALDVRKALKRATEDNRIPGYALSISRNADGEEVVSGVSRALLAVDDPQFQPKAFPRRRVTPGGMTPPKHDNRPLARVLSSPKKPKPV